MLRSRRGEMEEEENNGNSKNKGLGLEDCSHGWI